VNAEETAYREGFLLGYKIAQETVDECCGCSSLTSAEAAFRNRARLAREIARRQATVLVEAEEYARRSAANLETQARRNAETREVIRNVLRRQS
jgi:hypothetical protein